MSAEIVDFAVYAFLTSRREMIIHDLLPDLEAKRARGLTGRERQLLEALREAVAYVKPRT